MSNQKQFGVWMDTHDATIVSKDKETLTVSVLAAVTGEKKSPDPSEKTEHNNKKAMHLKFFKEIATHLVNAGHVHITGTGQAQEQFMHYLAGTPQFKNTRTDESTSNKMSDDKLVEFMTAKLN